MSQLGKSKTCCKCKNLKAIKNFALNGQYEDGTMDQCIQCWNIVKAIRREISAKKSKKSSEIWRARQKAIRKFFEIHVSMRAIFETLNQMKP